MADSGLVIIDKGAGLTSHDVVARVRRLAGTRKVGHAGTLDPMATGVLVVGTERATRLLGHLMLTDKSYDATVRLGAATHTDDAEGVLVSSADASRLTAEEIRAALATQVGEIEQVPTKVSAIKINGRRAYDLVREGIDIGIPARPVTVHELVVHDIASPTVADQEFAGRDGDGEVIASSPSQGAVPGLAPRVRIDTATVDVRISVRCSSGTYIRAIARDVGALLGVGGHLTALRRTAVGPYTLADAHTLEELSGAFAVLPISAAARAAFPSYDLDAARERDVRVGRKVELALGGLSAVFAPDGEFLALYEPAGGSTARPVAVFVG